MKERKDTKNTPNSSGRYTCPNDLPRSVGQAFYGSPARMAEAIQSGGCSMKKGFTPTVPACLPIPQAGRTGRDFGIEPLARRAMPKFTAGFTLLELLVSISIFVIITTIAVFNNSQFNSSVLLTNLAYEVALSIRQVQSYGISVKAGGSGVPVFDSGYGVRFDLTDSTTKKSYIIFEDKALADRVYTSNTDTTVETFTLNKGNTIYGIYLSGASCFTSGQVDITFLRPNPNATIMKSGVSYTNAEIYLSSPSGAKRKVVVENTGQIQVDTSNLSSCP